MSPQIIRVPTEDEVFRHRELLKKSQNTRRRFQEFFVEGVKAITQARRHRWPIRSLVYAAGRPLSPWARDTLAETPAAKRIEVTSPLMDRLSDKNLSSELVAVVAMPPDSPDRLTPKSDVLVAVLDRPSSPGNLGSIIRSCHALGADGLYWDEMDGVDYARPRLTARLWDSHTCVLTADGAVEKRVGLASLLSEPVKLSYAGDGFILGNTPPTTRRAHHQGGARIREERRPSRGQFR